MALFRCMTTSGGGGGQCASGSFSRLNDGQTYKIPLGFRPSYFACWIYEAGASGTGGFSNTYCSDYDTGDKALWLTRGAQAGAIYELGTNTANRIYKIENDGVTMGTTNANTVGTWYYVAIE